jgi:hypothetical protein
MIRTTRDVLLVAATCCLLTHAGIAADEETGLNDFLHRHTWQVGPQVSYFEYHEPGGIKEDGTLFGFDASYYYRPWIDADNAAIRGSYMLGLEGRLAFGQVDYDGSLLDGTPYTMRDVDDSLFELRILAGPDFPTSAGLTTLYFGFGYRYLNDDSSSDPHGYERESNYFYLPLGLQHARRLSDRWVLTPGAEIDLLIAGRQVSHLGDTHAGYDDMTNDQTSGYGLRGSLRLEKNYRYFGLAFDPFITYWDIDESDREVNNGMIMCEPSNWSLEYGLRLIFSF